MRILFSSWGSAGDLFPLIPIARAAESDGHRVHFLVPRALGLYLRALGIRASTMGSGTEVKAVSDPAAFSSRFDGWSAWRTTWVKYLAPELSQTVAAAERAIDSFDPDVVVTTTFATAARIAAVNRHVAHVTTSIYPQHKRLVDRTGRRFALRYVAQVARETALRGGDTWASIAWGVDANTLWLHDRALLGPHLDAASRIVGFPYWDGAVEASGAGDEAQTFIRRGEPPFLVTLGSFIGLHRRDVLEVAVDAVVASGRRCLVVGAPREAALGVPRGWACAVPFTPLSTLVAACPLVIHHGGIGTMFGVLRAGRPAVIVPQAYDQFFNAQLIDISGTGIDASRSTIGVAIDSGVDRQAEMTVASEQLSRKLVEPTRAAADALARIQRSSHV